MTFGRKIKKADDQLLLQLRGRLAATPGLVDGEDLYSTFHSTAVYLGFDNGTLGLWGMNYAELASLGSGSDSIAEFQVSPLANATEIVPQLFKCAETSLACFGDFELETVEVNCAPGKAQNMSSRLSGSLGLFRAFVPAQSVQARARLNWYSDAKLQESDLEKLFSESNIDPFEIELDFEPTSGRTDMQSPPRRGRATAALTLPACSLDCAGWLVSFLISSLAPVGAEDITVLLELA